MPNPTIADRLAPRLEPRLEPGRESWRPQREPSAVPSWVKRGAILAAGVLMAGGLVAGVVSLLGHGSQTVPVIEAATGPLRVKPSDPGGMQIAGAEDQIMDGTVSGHADVMAPPPEAPAPQVLAAQIQASHPAAPPPVVPAPAAPPPDALAAAAATPPPVAPPVMPAARASAAPAKAAPSDGKTQVQLAAMTTQDGAMAEWQRLSRKMPDLLGAHRPAIVQTDRDGRTFYRLRTGGFADVTAASEFCTAVRSKGGACTVASF